MSTTCQHVVWDWNGTLFDDLEHCVRIVNAMLARRGLPAISRERYLSVFAFPVRGYYEEVGFDFASESFEALSHEFILAYEAERHACSVHPEARGVLEHVVASGRGQSLLSAYPHATLVPLVRHLELDPLFSHVVGLDDVFADGKLAQGQRLLDALDEPPGTVLLVGDTLHDEVAATLGTQCVLVAHGHQSRQRLQCSGVPVVDSLAALYDIL